MSKLLQKTIDKCARVAYCRNHGIQAGVLMVLLLLPVVSVWADSIRCGTKVVRSGDAESVLVRACGEPKRRDSAQERVGSGSSQKTVRVQRWYYKSSGRKLERVVMLYNGKIIAVRTGGR